MIRFFKRFPLMSSIILSAVIGLILVLVELEGSVGLDDIIFGVAVYGAFMVLPFTFTAAEILLLVKGWKNQGIHKKGIRFDLVGIVRWVKHGARRNSEEAIT